MNWHAVRAIYRFEMARTFRTLVQSILTPVLTTSLYFVVFGSAIGSRMTEIGGVPFARLHRARPDHAVGAHREHRQRLLRHLLPEVVAARSTNCCRRRWRAAEILLGYVGAAASKSDA